MTLNSKRILGLALAICCLPIIAGQSSKRIFRYVDIEPNGSIELGKQFGDLRTISIELEPSVFRLNQGTFIGAREITVRLAPTGKVACVEFDYSAEDNFDETVAEYWWTLGKPITRDLSSRGNTIVWEDKKTSFALVQAQDGPIRSVLADKKLCEERSRLTCR